MLNLSEIEAGNKYRYHVTGDICRVVCVSKRKSDGAAQVTYEMNEELWSVAYLEFNDNFSPVSISDGSSQSKTTQSKKKRIEDAAFKLYVGYFASCPGRFQFSDCIEDAETFVSMIDERYPD